MIPVARGFVPVVASALVLATGCGSDSEESGGSSPSLHVDVGSVTSTPNKTFDAALDSKGEVAYFTQTTPDGPGVIRVPAAGGTPSTVFVGAPFVAPRGLALSSDDKTIYVTDPGVAQDGEILALPVAGDAPVPIQGTEGTKPDLLDVVTEGGADVLYFTGVAPDGRPALLKIPAGGGEATVLASGSPLVSPEGVAVATGGEVFVVDRGPSEGQGAVYSIREGKITEIATGVLAGDPAGAALLKDGSKLLVSARDPETGNSEVLIVDAATHATSIFNDVIGENVGSAGLHRARGLDEFVWVGVAAGVPYDCYGYVFQVSLY